MADQTYRADEFVLNEAFSGLTNVVVLTDEAARKPKMLKALALGMPCVASSWIERAKMDVSPSMLEPVQGGEHADPLVPSSSARRTRPTALGCSPSPSR